MAKQIHTDLTVIGGGIAGMVAALTAARHGLRVALVEWRDVLGGNNSSEYRVHLNGAANANASFYAREAGIVDEIKLSVFHQNPRYNFKEDYDLTDMAFLSLIRAEKNISLFLGTAAYAVEMDGDRLTAVHARKARTEEEFCFLSPLYADASGDGVVAERAGAAYRMGREARTEYNESLAPETADSHTMGSCILFTVGKADHPVPFIKPDFAYDYQKDDILKFVERPDTGRSLPKKLDGVDGIWWLSIGGMDNTIKDSDKIDLELKRLVYGFWDYVKNSGAYENTENYYLKWVAPAPARRESRRFIGDYVLHQNDLIEQTEFYDRVATGGWSIDVHDPGGVYGSLATSTFARVHGLYNIPYRIMYTKDVENLFLCGRIASMTHIALGSLRVMQTLGAMAQAVGTAAYLCKRDGLLPRDIAEPTRTKEMQTILQRDGQYIKDLCEDVGIAAKATVTASKTTALENTHTDCLFPLSRTHVLALPIANDRLTSVEIGFKNETDKERTISVRLFAARRQDAYEGERALTKTTITLPPRADGFFPAVFDACDIPHHLALIYIDACEGVSLYVTREHMVGAPCFVTTGDRISARLFRDEEPKVHQYYAICFRSLTPQTDLYAPENVINGWQRPIALPNMWRAPLASQPTLTLSFDEPQDVEEIQILFNGQTESDHFSTVVDTLTREFTLTVEHEGGSTITEVCDNYLALYRHACAYHGVRKISITVKDAYNSPYADIFSVKVF
ncbi:MAG: FAD-dependent oxidoreductase [Clostridia bacterium]|nr:FAD-dependent oxidoreductase [Clostridia bacterium]